MNILESLRKRLKNMHRYAKYALCIGALTMFGFYITAAFAYLIAPHVIYGNAMLIHRGCLEAAPASLAAGACAAVIGDMMLKKNGGDRE